MNKAYEEYIGLARVYGDSVYPSRNPTWMHHFIELKARENEHDAIDSDG